MKFSLNINNTIVTHQNLNDVRKNCEVWEKDILDFLTEWADDKDYLFVNSSGSTGAPKKISLLKKDMIASAQLTCDYFQLQPNDTALLCLPAKYIAGKMMLIRAIVRNLQLISVKPATLPNYPYNKKIDFAAMTPMQIRAIINESTEKINCISQLIIGGAPVDQILENDLQNISTQCYNTFGMTETITHIAVKKLNGANKSDFFEGLKNISFTTGKKENLIIHAPHLSHDVIVTNDVVALKDSTRFEWIGRNDNIINSGGIKIHPEKVEKKLAKLLLNNRFFISSQKDKTLGEAVILVIESKNNSHPEWDFSTILDKYEIPRKIYTSSNFSETETGKINRGKTLKKLNIDV